MDGSKKRKITVIIVIILFVIIILPLAVIVSSFIGKITPDSIIPDSYDIYASIPDPVRFSGKVLDHDSLPDIMALGELTPLISQINQLNDLKLFENRLVRLAAKGRLDAAFLSGERLLISWDAGILSPLLKFLPSLSGQITLPGLYYVKAGKNSRFEYRMPDNKVFFIGYLKNLLVISNNSALYESVIAGTSRDGDRFGSGAKRFDSKNYDVAFLLSPQALKNALGGKSGAHEPDKNSAELMSALDLLPFSGPVQMSLTILPHQLRFRIISPLGTGVPALHKITSRNSQATPLNAMVPGSAQYMTLISAGSLDELLGAVSAITARIPNSDFETAMRRADTSSRAALSMNLEELLFSWTGTQFAVFGLEGRPHPVIAMEIKDETKRREVFNKAFSTIFLNENIQLNLDGSRIPRIQIPSFLNSFLQLLDVNVPSPYYTIQNNYLFISESAETLLSAINSVRRNDVLPRTELWRTLSENNSGPSSFSLFYSLDRSLPFFLSGQSEAMAVLRLYRQGLARLYIENQVLNVTLSVIPGAGKGLIAAPPLDLSGTVQVRTGNRLYQIGSGKDSRLLLTRSHDILMINPLDRSIKEVHFPGSPGSVLHVAPFPGSHKEAAAWIVNSQGQVNLVNRDMEHLFGFPHSTGIKLSSPPAAWGDKLFLSDEDGSIHVVDSRASVGKWGTVFSSAIRSPLSFLDFRNRTYAALYPKSIIAGEIYLLDDQGKVLPAWPVPVSGIAYGSPLLFTARGAGSSQERLFAAFITQAGELTVYAENAQVLPGFPVELEGVFYLQPVFDGESLWIIESEGTLYRIELNGEVLKQKIPRVSVKEEGYITTAHTSIGKSGAKPDIFFSGEGNALYGYSRSFNSLDGFPLPVWGRPVFADINNDRKIEAAGIGMDNKLYIWQFR